MTQPLSDAMLRMLKARERVARRNLFFADIIYGARFVESTQGPSMWTDGKNVFFNPEFVAQYDKHVEGVVLHEVLHCALNHIGRRGGRDPELWQQACDHSINPMVKSVYNLPSGGVWDGLSDPRFKDMSAEQIYEVLQQEQKPQNKDGKSKSKGGGGKNDGKDKSDDKGDGKPKSGDFVEPDPEQQEANEREWKRITTLAAERAEKAGQMPANLQRLLEELNPEDKIDWRTVIADMAHEAKSPLIGSWSRPNRRFIGAGTYMPGTLNDNVYRLVVCFDVSGSVNDAQFRQMKAEVMSLLDQQIITHATLISTDTRVCNMADVTTSEEVKNFQGLGGGGTDFREAMARVGQVPDAVGCVFLTDMQTNSFGEAPGFPVVWVDWLNRCPKPPFGKVMPYN